MEQGINNKIDRALEDFRAPFPDKEHSWERIMLRTGAQEASVQEKKSVKPMWSKLALAASLFLAFGLYFVLQNGNVQLQTAATEQIRHELPDGSVVYLNAVSSLSYDASSFAEERTINLDGEAFFEVEKGATFRVITDQGQVEVLGTSFNVYDRDEDFKVQCKTGKVAVEQAQDRVVLSPGLATDDSQGKLAAAYPLEAASEWRNGFFQYDDAHLVHVMEEMERQFGVNIQLQDVESRYFTGEFENSDLETALQVICIPMGLDYEIGPDNSITITNKN